MFQKATRPVRPQVVDRGTFVRDLENVNTIRNDVMHFDPDGISPDDLEELRKTANFLQELRAISQPA
jgi:hypothetical protein